MRPARRRATRALALALALVTIGPPAATGAPARPVVFDASFDGEARPGAPTPLRFAVRLVPRAAAVTRIAVSYPAVLGLATSGLGLASCERPAHDYAAVIISGRGLGCPPNAIIARGDAIAHVTMGDDAIPATGLITLLAGPLERRGMRLTALVSGRNPFGVLLLFAGELGVGERRDREQFAITLPTIPDLPEGAAVSINQVDLTIGRGDIVYADAGRRWHPGGIILPATCPTRSYRFRFTVDYADGAHLSAHDTIRCPA